MSVKESLEANLIYKSVSQVQLFIDDVRGRHYKMKCDVQPLTDNNPMLLCTHKTFCRNPIFVCENIMIKMLDYKFTKDMTIVVWNNLPKAYKNALKSYVER